MKTILIQGAMNEEIVHLIRKFKAKKKIIEGFNFYLSKYKDNNIVISLTNMGTVNAGKATRIGLKHFKPEYVLNTGLCGAHIRSLHVNEIIVGDKVSYLNKKNKQLTLFGSRKLSRLVDTIPTKLDIFHGVMGSANLFTKNKKVIDEYHKKCHQISEDMESIAVYYECEEKNVECLAIRIISNNEILKESFEKNHLKADKLLQDFIFKLVNAIVNNCL